MYDSSGEYEGESGYLIDEDEYASDEGDDLSLFLVVGSLLFCYS